MTNFLTHSDFLSSEWAPVISVALVFFLLQVFLCISFCFRMRRQERAIERLNRDFEEGGDTRNGVRSLGRRHTWLHWVDSNFLANFTSSGNFTREDALQELDTQIA